MVGTQIGSHAHRHLDPLGNWSSVGTDLDGTGGIDSDETEVRDHRDPSLTPPTNRVNGLCLREKAPSRQTPQHPATVGRRDFREEILLACRIHSDTLVQ